MKNPGYRIETNAQPEDFAGPSFAVRRVGIYRGDMLLYEGVYNVREYSDPFQMIRFAISDMYRAVHAVQIV